MNQQAPENAVSVSSSDDGPVLARAGPIESLDIPIERHVACITKIDLSLRERMRGGPFDLQTHQRYFRHLPALWEIELGGAEYLRESADRPVRVGVWNVERLRDIEAVGSLLGRHRPEIILLSEVDKGMARSRIRHCLADLAGRLGHSFAYGVEFVELDLGDEKEILAGGGE